MSETQKKVIMNDIGEEVFDQDMCRRLQYIVMHKYERCMQRLKDEWMPKLKEYGIESVPTNDDKLAELIFQQSGYQNRSEKDKENILNG